MLAVHIGGCDSMDALMSLPPSTHVFVGLAGVGDSDTLKARFASVTPLTPTTLCNEVCRRRGAGEATSIVRCDTMFVNQRVAALLDAFVAAVADAVGNIATSVPPIQLSPRPAPAPPSAKPRLVFLPTSDVMAAMVPTLAAAASAFEVTAVVASHVMDAAAQPALVAHAFPVSAAEVAMVADLHACPGVTVASPSATAPHGHFVDAADVIVCEADVGNLVSLASTRTVLAFDDGASSTPPAVVLFSCPEGLQDALQAAASAPRPPAVPLPAPAAMPESPPSPAGSLPGDADAEAVVRAALDRVVGGGDAPVELYAGLGGEWPVAGPVSLPLLATTLAGFGAAAFLGGGAASCFPFPLATQPPEVLVFLATNLPQLGLNDIPPHLWLPLHTKLANGVVDANAAFCYAVDGDDMCVIGGPEGVGTDTVYLLPHAVTLRTTDMVPLLTSTPGAMDRVKHILGHAGWPVAKPPAVHPPPASPDVVWLSGREDVSEVEATHRNMWPALEGYRLMSDTSIAGTSVWFLLNEFGGRFRHSDTPNVRMATVRHGGEVLTVLWATEPIADGEEATRDYAAASSTPDARLVQELLVKRDVPAAPFLDARAALEAADGKFPSGSAVIAAACGTAGAGAETLPGGTLRVFTDSRAVRDHLHRPDFEFVDTPEGADILWTLEDLENAGVAATDAFANHFPGEMALTSKRGLAKTAYAALGRRGAAWLPVTFDMTDDAELMAFVGEYHRRAVAGEDNHWILKAINRARSEDCFVTPTLAAALRIGDTWSRVACKYIHRCLLFDGCKFDLRYIVVVRSFQPLELAVCNTFWIRFANNKYTLDPESMGDYETHFTVMNYGETAMRQMGHEEFIAAIEAEHDGLEWAGVNRAVHASIKELFACAAVTGDVAHPRRRAEFGVDVMVDEDLHSHILEVTMSPDTARANLYTKGYCDAVFGYLFRGEDRLMTAL